MSDMYQEENKKKYLEFVEYLLEKYPELCPPEYDYCRSAFKWFVDYNDKYFINCDFQRQVYDELGIIPDINNVYLGFLEEIKKEFTLENKEVTEIGGGYIPSLAKHIIKDNDTVKVTVYDPNLLEYTEDTDRLKLVKEKLTRQSKIKKPDLLIGFMPCKGAEIIVDLAIKNKVDFIIGLCEGGEHGDYEDWFDSAEDWRNYVKYCAEVGLEQNENEGNYMGKLKVKTMDGYNYDYPIIYNKR